MANVRYGIGITELRGKIGGACFSKCQSGYIVSNVPYPRVSTSQFNRLAKQAVQLIASSWLNLSATQKLAWTTQAALSTFYNSLGEPYTPTGYQLYFAINDRIARYGGTLISSAVAWSVATQSVAQPTGITYASNTLSFGFNPVVVANSFYAIYSYNPQRKQYQGSNPPWRLIGMASSYNQNDTTLVPVLKSRYPSLFRVGMYAPIMQISQNYVTGEISRLGLPSLVLIS